MGVREILGVNPVEIVNDLISTSSNTKGAERRRLSRQRVDMFYDKGGEVLRERMASLFQARADNRKERVAQFATFSSSLSIFRRVVNELATPVYNPPPLRVVVGEDGTTVDEVGNAAYFDICKAARLNQRMDIACRMMGACNDVILGPKYSTGLKRLVVDVITPAISEVITHPDDPSEMIGFLYQKQAMRPGEHANWVFWDDSEAFEVGKNGQIVRVLSRDEHPGFLPFMAIHATERVGSFWDENTGNDLVNAQMTAGLALAHALRLHHTQGHTLIAIAGDPANFPKEQMLDPEVPFYAGEGNTVTAINSPTDPGPHLRTIEMVTMAVAANNGLSRERMNASGPPTDQAAMYERRYETVQVMAEAEQRLFALVAKVMGAALPLAPGARLAVDFPDVSAKGDRKTQLEVRKMERHQGIRSVLDDVLEDNPELGADRTAAKAYAESRMEEEAWYIEKRRALGISGEATSATPGQPQEQNGAMGPAVRDGHMTKDEAAAQAHTGPSA